MTKHTAILSIIFAATTSHAAVAFNTFGPGDSSKTFGWGFGDIQDARIATQFTPTVSGTLNTIQLKLQSSATPGNATISVFQDSANNFGTLMTVMTTWVSTEGVKTVTNSNPSAQLISGNKYWIEAKVAPGSGIYSGWFRNNQGVNGSLKFGSVGSGSYGVGSGELPAFRVTVTPVPEPTTMAAFGIFALMAALRRRKTK